MRGNWKWTLCTDGAWVPMWVTIRGIEWAVGAEVTTKARDCFMQRKQRGNKSEMADGDMDHDKTYGLEPECSWNTPMMEFV